MNSVTGSGLQQSAQISYRITFQYIFHRCLCFSVMKPAQSSFSQHKTDFKKPPLFALKWEGPRDLQHKTFEGSSQYSTLVCFFKPSLLFVSQAEVYLSGAHYTLSLVAQPSLHILDQGGSGLQLKTGQLTVVHLWCKKFYRTGSFEVLLKIASN